METDKGDIQIIKEEAAPIPAILVDLFDCLRGYNTEFDERSVQMIGEEFGFTSSDDKV